MHVVAVVHKYPPEHNAGAEWMLHSILREWVARGDDCFVLYPKAEPLDLDGVRVRPTPVNIEGALGSADLVLTHLDLTQDAMRAARGAGLPILHLVHNDAQLRFHDVEPAADTLVAFNSEWLRDAYDWRGPAVVCRPLVRCGDYDTEHREDRVTLINVSRAKGSSTFYELARRLPERGFLAVAGAYGVDDTRRAARFRNVEVVANTPNVRDDVYARTRVLLMPSHYESWGRCAIEAGASGIPTIAHPTPGLLEALDDAGLYAEHRATREWVQILRCLDDPNEYDRHAGLARRRAVELESIAMTDVLELREAAARLAGGLPSPAAERAPAPVAGAAGAGAPRSSTSNVAVLVPFAATDDSFRGWAHEFVRDHVERAHPAWQLLSSADPSMVAGWSKGAALRWLRQWTTAEILVVLDADCIASPRALEAAVADLEEQPGWAVPFDFTHRLSRRVTEQVLRRRKLPIRGGLEHVPRRALAGGGCVVLASTVYDDVPMDPRFLEWGGEDEAWGFALTTIYGRPLRYSAPLKHLWHQHAVPDRSRRPVRQETRALLDRYRRAQGKPDAMRAILSEIPAAGA